MLMRRALYLLLAAFFSAPALFSQIINTVAGGGPNNVPATSANLNQPSGVVADVNGNLYIAVSTANRIFQVDSSGQLTVVAGLGMSGFSGDGGPAVNALLNSPIGLALDGTGNLFFSDANNQRIRKVNLSTGIISTLAGTGTA